MRFPFFTRRPKQDAAQPKPRVTQEQALQAINAYRRRIAFVNSFSDLPSDLRDAWIVGAHNRLADKVRGYTEDYEHLDQEEAELPKGRHE